MAASFPTSQAIVVGGGLGGRELVPWCHGVGWGNWGHWGGMKKIKKPNKVKGDETNQSLMSLALSRHVGRQHCGGERWTCGVASRILRFYCELVQKFVQKLSYSPFFVDGPLFFG